MSESKSDSVFFDRYADLCTRRGLDPSCQTMIDALGVARSTITAWKRRRVAPSGKYVALAAEFLGTSTDYLLGRTDIDVDPYFHGSPKDIAPQMLLHIYAQLDSADRDQLDHYAAFLLQNAKYRQDTALNA